MKTITIVLPDDIDPTLIEIGAIRTADNNGLQFQRTRTGFQLVPPVRHPNVVRFPTRPMPPPYSHPPRPAA